VACYKDEALVKAALADPETAPIPPRVRAMMRFLRALTLTPESVGGNDVRALYAAGLDDRAIESALYVAFVFDVMDRLADAFGFELNDARGLKWVARVLLKAGYGAGVVPG